MRYIPLTPQDQKQILEELEISSVNELFSDIHPDIQRGEMSELPSAKSEFELRDFFSKLSNKNTSSKKMKSFLGAGCYEHYIPSIVGQLASRGEFVTAYTPYQAEISQGTLQAIFEFQSMTANLYGMEVSNASMYDGASSLAEAVLMSLRVNPGKHVYLSQAIHPDYRLTVESYLSDYEVQIHTLPLDENGQTKIENIQSETSCIVIGQPNFYGVIENLESAAKEIHSQKAMFVVVNQEALAFGLLPAPGEFGADIVVGEGQSLGVDMSFGGPFVGLFTTQKKYVRNMPGRLVGKTTDENGEPGYVLTLSTREQHIRREKATSNICTNHSLCALRACIYMACVGERGLREIALRNYNQAHALFDQLTKIDGIQPMYKGDFFNEFVVTLPIDANVLIEKMLLKEIMPGVALSRFDSKNEKQLLITVTETKTGDDLNHFVSALKEVL